MFRVLAGLGVLFVGLGALFLAGGLFKGPGQAVTQGTLLITAGLTVLAIYEIHHRLVKLRQSFESLERRQNQILDVLMRQSQLSPGHVLNGIPSPGSGAVALSPMVNHPVASAHAPVADAGSPDATLSIPAPAMPPVEVIPVDEPTQTPQP